MSIDYQMIRIAINRLLVIKKPDLACQVSLLKEEHKDALREIVIKKDALKTLIELKDYRDEHGKTEEYIIAKTLAWQRARDALK